MSGTPRPLPASRDSEVHRCHCGAWRASDQTECLACQAIQARYVPGREPLR